MLFVQLVAFGHVLSTTLINALSPKSNAVLNISRNDNDVVVAIAAAVVVVVLRAAVRVFPVNAIV